MKKLIPFLTIVTGSVFLQNCTQRDEEITQDKTQFEQVKQLLRAEDDSTKSSEHLYPDPPVKDGDDWRIAPKKATH
jgi:hypothetical protein